MLSRIHEKIDLDDFNINILKNLLNETDEVIIDFLNELTRKIDFAQKFRVVEREVSDFNIGQYAEHLYVINQNIAYFLWDNNFSKTVVEFAVKKTNGVFISNEGINIRKVNSAKKIDTLLSLIEKYPDNYLYKNYTLFSLLFNLRDLTESSKSFLINEEKESYQKKINEAIYSRYFSDNDNNDTDYNITVYNQEYHAEYCGFMPTPGSLNETLINHLIRYSHLNEASFIIKNKKIEWDIFKDSQYHPLIILQNKSIKNNEDYELFDLIISQNSVLPANVKERILNVADKKIWDIIIKNQAYDIDNLVWDYCKKIVELKDRRLQFKKVMTLVSYLEEKKDVLRHNFATDFLFSYPVDVNASPAFIDLFSAIKSHSKSKPMIINNTHRF